MSIHKVIYWGSESEVIKGYYFAQLHYSIGYCPDNLEEFKKMAEEVKKDFPDLKLKDKDFTCSTIRTSDRYKNFTIVVVGVKLEKKDYKGWDNGSLDKLYYYW